MKYVTPSDQRDDPCECSAPKDCPFIPRHTRLHFEQCKWKKGYREVYQQPPRTASRQTPRIEDGPGTELKALLASTSALIESVAKWIPVKAIRESVETLATMFIDSPNCPCNGHAQTMNQWGPAKCRERIGTIIGWLRAEAERRKLPFSDAVAKQVVLHAIRRSEAKEGNRPFERTVVAVTTCRRTEPTLEATLASLKDAGWPNVHVFTDGPGVRMPQGYEVTIRSRRIGAWPNWWLALSEMYQKHPNAELYMIVQDDVEFASGLREYIERQKFTDAVYSLYHSCRLSQHHLEKNGDRWVVYTGGRGFIGALALLFPRDVARRLLGSSIGVEHRTEHRGTDFIDGTIGRWCKENSVPFYVHVPSLCQHTGHVSTLGHKEGNSKTFISDVMHAIRKAEAREARGRVALVVPSNESWNGPARAQLFRRVLDSAGYSASILPVSSKVHEKLGKYDLVVNHAMILPPDSVRKAASDNPRTTFVTLNHSALAHLESTGERYTRRYTESIRLARDLPNCWYAMQEPVADSIRLAYGVERCVWWPTPAHLLKSRPYRPPNDPAVIVLAGRQDSIKNHLVQLVACGMRNVRLVLCMQRRDSMQETLDQLGIDHEWRGRLPHPQWIQMLREDPDVVLCCSLSESFCYVAVEAMQTGIPVVASEAIRFADPNLVARSNDPRDVADKIEEAIRNHRTHAENAAEIGRVTADLQRAEYLSKLADMLAESAVGRAIVGPSGV